MKKLKLIINNTHINSKKETFFVKNELKIILNLYARMVSNGSWKDYGLSLGPREISFDIYQRTSDKPILKILKNLKPANKKETFLIKDKNGMIIEKSENLINLIEKINWLKLKIVV